MTTPLTRRHVLAAGAAGALAAPGLAALAQAPHPAAGRPVLTRPIPHSGEQLPVIGIGTAVIFDFQNDPEKKTERAEVLKTLAEGGGKLVDTAPAYGNAEVVLGDLVSEQNLRNRLFLATKIAAAHDRAGQIAEMGRSQERMKTRTFDLMQLWNPRDAATDLGLLRDWKAQGICRYYGISSSFERDYAALEQILKREKPDFFQINYSLGDREAEERLLPAAAEVGAAVLTNLPFGRNSLFRKAQGVPLPDWAAEIDATSWAQVFLKFNLSHPAVNAVIPGTDKPEYMVDNLNAGRGRLPDAAMRKRIVDYWNSLPEPAART